jgi:NADPH:quinone reductase-like Zn-dependent oxidoreductase
MRAYAIDEFGKPGSIREVETPKPGEGEVLLRVRAAGVNAFDVVVVNGFAKDYMEHRFPQIPGLDGSGEVASLGPGVEGVSVGDEVFGNAQKPYQGAGTYGEFVSLSATSVTAKPSFLDHVGAAAMPLAGLTAVSAVEAVDPGESNVVLVIGATGGVGSYATQLLANRGARVLAVARAEYADYALSLGASEAIDYTTGDLAEQVRTRAAEGLDAVIDLSGNKDVVSSLLDQVRAGGVAVSAAGGVDDSMLEARGLKGGSVNRAGLDRLSELTRLLEEKQLVLPALRTYPLEQAADALAEQAGRHVKGKLVLIVD